MVLKWRQLHCTNLPSISCSFIVTRAVSDLANGKADISFEEFLGEAAKSSSSIVESLIKVL